VVGAYVPEVLGLDDPSSAGTIGWDYGTFFTKGQRRGTGQAPVKRYNRQLRDMILAGRANPGLIVSHELGLDQAVDAFEHFDNREHGWTKVPLKPGPLTAPRWSSWPESATSTPAGLTGGCAARPRSCTPA
jgi:glutathione-independent formaldehyde dehydrogenase